jgi:uncharacterized membrane protein
VVWKLCLIALPVFFAIDMVWLGLISKNFYREHLGSLMRSEVSWAPALIFYGLFVVGLVVLVVAPAVDAGSWMQAVGRGALFGLVTYATYDLTNMATLRDWPMVLTLVDLAWGTVLAASVSIATYAIGTRLGV